MMTRKQELTPGQRAAATRKKNREAAALAAQAAEYSAEHGTITVGELIQHMAELDRIIDELSRVTIEALKVSFPLGNKSCFAEFVDGQWHLSWS